MVALEAEERHFHLTTNLHNGYFWQVNTFLPVLSDNTNQSHNFPNSILDVTSLLYSHLHVLMFTFEA